MANTGQHDFIEFVCKPVEDLYLSSGEKRVVRIPKLTEYRCSMLRDQHFHSLFRHYGKHNGVDKETLVFFFTEELMQELDPDDTPRSVHLRKNDTIVIRHRHKPTVDGMSVRFDLKSDDALELIRSFPRARSFQSADGRTALHHVASRGGDPSFAEKLLVLGCDPRTLDNYGRTAEYIAGEEFDYPALAKVLKPNEFKRQMAVIREQFVIGKKKKKLHYDDDDRLQNIMNLKRHCSSDQLASANDAKHVSAVHFLFSTLAHGNQARNFKRVICFL